MHIHTYILLYTVSRSRPCSRWTRRARRSRRTSLVIIMSQMDQVVTWGDRDTYITMEISIEMVGHIYQWVIHMAPGIMVIAVFSMLK